MAKKSANTYQVQYLGGLLEHPKAVKGFIDLTVGDDSFTLEPTRATAKWWAPLSIPFESVNDVARVARIVGTAESLLGGLNTRQLNQDNNLHFDYVDAAGKPTVLRVEMLSGITVMNQAKKAAELEDHLLAAGIRARFRQASAPAATPAAEGLPEQIAKLAALRDAGVLTEDEFAAKKAELLARI